MLNEIYIVKVFADFELIEEYKAIDVVKKNNIVTIIDIFGDSNKYDVDEVTIKVTKYQKVKEFTID